MHPILAVCASIPLAEPRHGSMLRNTSLALLYSALVAFAPGLAAQPSASKASAAKTSFPQAFPPDTERLPKGYRGVDARRFFALFTSRAATLKRGEYETTEEYQARTGDLGRTLAPISPDVLYAFRAEDFDIEYDADSEQFNVYRSNVCQDRTSHEGSFGVVTCRLSPLKTVSRSYVASNAYGAQAEVESFEGEYFGVTVKAGSRIIDGYVSSHEVPKGEWVAVRETIKIPRERARKIGTKGIEVLFVGRVTGTQVVTGPKTHSRPTRDFAFENKRQTFAIPFEVEEVVFYVPATGEILQRKKASAPL